MGVRHLPAVARQDFSGIVPMLIELDRGHGAGTLHGVALSASLLLAAGHADCLTVRRAWWSGSTTSLAPPRAEA